MFYCDECGGKNKWPTYYGLPQSRGPCEVCDKVRGCYDVPSSSLPKKPELSAGAYLRKEDWPGS